MEHRFDLAVVAGGELVVEGVHIDIVSNLEVHQVTEFVALLEVVDRNDVGHAAGIEPRNDVAANETGRAGDHDTCHTKSSS